ncbi:translation elongation factor 1-alpha, partial [Striga asiatica]
TPKCHRLSRTQLWEWLPDKAQGRNNQHNKSNMTQVKTKFSIRNINRTNINQHTSFGTLLSSSLCDLSTRSILLLHTLDNTNCNSLPHVTHGKTTKRRVLSKSLHNHGLGRNHLNKPSITILQELGLLLQLLTRPPINLSHELGKFDSNVGSVAVEHGGIALTNLPRVVHDNNLRGKVSSFLGRVILRVGSHITTLQILHSNILHIEPNVITWEGLLHGLMVHLNRLDLSG